MTLLVEDFISKVCNDLRKAVESASEVTLEGREREFRRVLARYLFDETLGWEGHSKIGEIYDVTCFDDENFPVVLIETKWRVEPSPQTKEKQRNRIEELGSVKYGVFASERDFIVYEYVNYKLEDVVKINVAEAVGFARGEYGLSDIAKRRIVKLETLKRDCLVWIEEDLGYFKETCREISLAKGDGVDLLIKNLKNIARELADALVDFFDSYWKREDYSGRFLRKHFNDWLKNSMKQKGFEEGNEEERQKVVEVFCRETAYVLVGRVLFTRICEDKEIISPTNLSGEGLIESLQFYERKMRKKPVFACFQRVSRGN